MSNHYILNADGEPEVCNGLMTWAKWFETANRHLALDTFGDVKVSTIFLGIDHSFGIGPPVLYETMVFGGALDGEMERYCTRAEADQGHTAMVQRVREAAAREQ